MVDSYEDGYKEGAIFLFYDGESILIEHRPTDGGTETFIPNGTIEEADKSSGSNDNYVLAALQREIDEEFSGQVEVESLDKLCEHKIEEPAIWFHSYVVTEWSGEVPDYTVEDGERYADLEWVPLDEYDEHLQFRSAVETCEELRAQVSEGTV
ncbi:NUDIX domain-containing protein [Halostella pelagica]|uniref:NUDIX domain-containing protein n=1 Tax=Halostella pelagica TaxID=2583824 RepID=UPI001080EA91|nr:NUDIX domain-containing protein [Halostella pelagica]